ncbi:MAG: type II toxin-antitoxin system RelE/ParE family toxin [Cyanobacteria bacterium P01_F01_bin.150]
MNQWSVEFCDEFDVEFETLDKSVQDELLAHALLLEKFGPRLDRPWVDTLNGSKYSNMKELRFKSASGVWRVAFAFDPNRNAIVLIAGNKAGQNQKRFYKKLIKIADSRFAKHIQKLGEL